MPAGSGACQSRQQRKWRYWPNLAGSSVAPSNPMQGNPCSFVLASSPSLAAISQLLRSIRSKSSKSWACYFFTKKKKSQSKLHPFPATVVSGSLWMGCVHSDLPVEFIKTQSLVNVQQCPKQSNTQLRPLTLMLRILLRMALIMFLDYV